jgi:U3 small nucleolar RNA-associated protein 5
LGPKETVTSLDWGYFGGKNRDQKKKRKRGSDVNGSVEGLDQGDVVVAIGTSTSDIRMFSPSEDKIVGTLTGAHDKGIKDFKFTAEKPAQEAWSIGGDNKLVQWDLRTGQSVRTIHLPASSTFNALSRPLSSNTPVVCASQTPFLIDVENSEEEPVKFPAMRNQIHTVISSSGSFLAADGERFINVFETSSQKLVRNLVAEQDVSSVSLLDNTIPEKQILAAVTDDGTIELFTKPFTPAPTATASAKANRKQMTQKANASLKVLRTGDSETCVPVVSTAFVGPEIIVAYAEGGVIPVFQRVKLLDEGTEELSFTGLKAIVKTKSSSAVASATLNGAKNVGEGRVDETHVVVEAGNIVDNDVEMNDDDEAGSASGSDVDSDVEDSAKPTSEKKTKSTKQAAPVDEDVDMENAASEDEDEEEEEGAEPSFGEIMRANAGQEVDVEAEMDEDNLMGALVPGKPTAAIQQIPTGVSLATVLTQSLKTNDKDMLESCFHTADTSIIRTTIQRLESPLAATLLQKLAERLSSRPGRYGHLLVWVQWTCVAHGGALAGHPELLNRMATLYKVMDQRSSSLPSLLLLKGKLDMLDAQLGLRQSIRGGDEMDSEDEDNVIYVEGQDDDEDDEAKPRTKSIRDSAFEEDEDESMLNGIADESEDDEDEDDEDDEDGYEGVLDIEAEESAGSSDAEESLEENEDDEDEDSEGSLANFVADTEDEESDEEMVEAPPPSKKAKTTAGRKKGGKK